MLFRTIMVQLDLDAPVAPRLEFARDIAGRFEADLVALVVAEARMPIPSDESGLAAAEAYQESVRAIEDRLKAMKEEFLGIAGNDERASWRAETGDPTHVVALHARAADLVVTGSPDDTADLARTIDPGTLILAAGRPVLFAAEGLQPLQGKRVLVAWKDTREARRAVADAMPFLIRAKEVVVAACAEGDSFKARDGGADVVRFLMKHGATARSEVLVGPSPDVAGALAAKAHDVGADLIVAGGYGHSRLREWAFGGVTRSLLSDGTLHRFLSN
ncbi:MAG: universal stress protein [Aquamicrobium sp.]|nr:universal stress protein [Aquamicrobium sp.]